MLHIQFIEINHNEMRYDYKLIEKQDRANCKNFLLRCFLLAIKYHKSQVKMNVQIS